MPGIMKQWQQATQVGPNPKIASTTTGEHPSSDGLSAILVKHEMQEGRQVTFRVKPATPACTYMQMSTLQYLFFLNITSPSSLLISLSSVPAFGPSDELLSYGRQAAYQQLRMSAKLSSPACACCLLSVPCHVKSACGPLHGQFMPSGGVCSRSY